MMIEDTSDIQPSLFELIDIEDEISYKPLLAFHRDPRLPTSTIKRLWIKNMKGFESLEVELSDFNVLVGPNNCGKSTVLQAIDLCFRLMQYHAEFQRQMLAKPRQGKLLAAEMLPVAAAEDLWFQRKYRVRSERIPVLIGIELSQGYEFEFEIKRQWGGLNSRMTKLPQGLPETVMRGILARRPTLVPSSVGVVRNEEYRVPARLELLAVTGHHNEVLRNFIRELALKSPSAFHDLQNNLKKHFGGTIGSIDSSPDSDQFVSVTYEEGEVLHDIFSAGGGFLQVLQFLTYLSSQAPGIILLDEPDAHLHSSLQRLVVDLLERLSQDNKVQVVLATHSKEIINYVDASYILPISKNLQVARSLEHHASVLPILQDLGSVDNVDLATLIQTKRCAFVEGKDDKTLLSRFAAKTGSTVFEGPSQVVMIPADGVDHPEKYLRLDFLDAVVGTPVKSLIIRDRDGLPDDLVEEIRSDAARQGRSLVVLERTHIENYLLKPAVIWRAVCGELRRRRAAAEADLPGIEEITEAIDETLNELHTETFDNIGVQINKHYVVYRKKHLDPSQINQLARAFLDQKWATLDGKISVVYGKRALAAIRRKFQEKWNVSFGDIRLIEEMSVHEIDQEIKDIIARVEAL